MYRQVHVLYNPKAVVFGRRDGHLKSRHPRRLSQDRLAEVLYRLQREGRAEQMCLSPSGLGLYVRVHDVICKG